MWSQSKFYITSGIKQWPHSAIFFRSVNQHIVLGMYKSLIILNLQLEMCWRSKILGINCGQGGEILSRELQGLIQTSVGWVNSHGYWRDVLVLWEKFWMQLESLLRIFCNFMSGFYFSQFLCNIISRVLATEYCDIEKEWNHIPEEE